MEEHLLKHNNKKNETHQFKIVIFTAYSQKFVKQVIVNFAALKRVTLSVSESSDTQNLHFFHLLNLY